MTQQRGTDNLCSCAQMGKISLLKAAHSYLFFPRFQEAEVLPLLKPFGPHSLCPDSSYSGEKFGESRLTVESQRTHTLAPCLLLYLLTNPEGSQSSAATMCLELTEWIFIFLFLNSNILKKMFRALRELEQILFFLPVFFSKVTPLWNWCSPSACSHISLSWAADWSVIW